MRSVLLALLLASSAVVMPARADGIMSLAGSEWGEGQTTGPFEVMVKFEQQNKVWGRLGCNRFTGTYKQDGLSLVFGPLATTRMACPEPNMKTEARVSAALVATRQADITHMKLVLQDDGGATLLELLRRDAD